MDQDMQQYLDKAEVLIEALTYIQRFNRKIIVVNTVEVQCWTKNSRKMSSRMLHS